MRAAWLVLVSLCWMLAPGTRAGGLAGSVELGDTRDQVLQALGDPQGTAQFGETTVLFYPRGQVDIENGQVVRQTLLTREAYEERQQQRQRAEEAARKAAAKQAEAQAAAPSPAQQAPPEPTEAEKKAAAAERAKELERRIAEGISQPPIEMSSSKARRFRRGRSPSQIEQRKQQIIEAFEAEQEKTP